MPQVDYDDVFNSTGKLISRTERTLPDPTPTAEERLAKLEATLEAVGNASSFADAKTAIKQRATESESRSPVS